MVIVSTPLETGTYEVEKCSPLELVYVEDYGIDGTDVLGTDVNFVLCPFELTPVTTEMVCPPGVTSDFEVKLDVLPSVFVK